MNLNARNALHIARDVNFNSPQTNGQEICSFVNHAETAMCHNPIYKIKKILQLQPQHQTHRQRMSEPRVLVV